MLGIKDAENDMEKGNKKKRELQNALKMSSFFVDLILPHLYSETKGFVNECHKNRIDLDEHIQSTIREWGNL